MAKSAKGARFAGGEVEYVGPPEIGHLDKQAIGGDAGAGHSPSERARYVRERESTRPDVTEWLNDDGSYVLQDGDEKSRTGQCPMCNRWFRIVRPKSARARWPKFCSDECRATSRATSARKGMRRLRQEGRVRPEPKYSSFDPDSPDAYWTAHEIVRNVSRDHSTTSAYNAADEYLRQIEREQRQPTRIDDPTELDDWG